MVPWDKRAGKNSGTTGVHVEGTEGRPYSSGQNKVPITYRLVSDFTAKLFRKVASTIAQPENFSTQTLFYFRVRLRNN